MTPFGKTILKYKMLLEELTNEYHGKLIPVSTAIEVASRAMNFQTAYDFESCLGVMQKAFDVNDGYFVDSADVVQVVPGKWLKQYHGQVNSICSVCGKESGRRADFCPNCGAKMDKGEE